MNNLFLKLLVAICFFVTSCDNYLDVNIDPNQSTTSEINLQLSTAQLQIAIGMGQRIYPILGTWCQYHTGGPGVALGDPDQHMLASSEGNEIFLRTYRAANNLNFILKNAPNEKNFVAIAKLMKAYGIQNCVDLFGDLPYNEALKGDIEDGSILHPKYDNAKDVIYPALISEVKEAIQLIADGAGFSAPEGNDLVYAGDMHKWALFANSLLLKLYLRSGQTTEAATLAASGAEFVIANEDAAMVRFPGGATGSNPFWTAAKSTALGNFYVATTTSINYLEATGDPRIDFIYDKNVAGGHNGLKPGDVENAPANSSTFSTPAGATIRDGGLMFRADMPVLFITAWETNLLLAEASTDAMLAAAFYSAAVQEHFSYLGIPSSSADTYLARAGNGYDASNHLKSIALQKWVCMNGLQPVESWIETRRFDHSGLPIFSTRGGGIFIEPTKNALGAGIFPSIMSYPESEESLNRNFPGQHDITAKLFWDK